VCKHSLTFRVWRYVVNETRAPIANPPSSAQLQGTQYHSPNLHPGPCSSAGMRRGTDRQTYADTQTAVTNIHLAWAMPHAKCNEASQRLGRGNNQRCIAFIVQTTTQQQTFDALWRKPRMTAACSCRRQRTGSRTCPAYCTQQHTRAFLLHLNTKFHQHQKADWTQKFLFYRITTHLNKLNFD